MQHAAALAKVLDERSIHPKLVYNCDETMVEISDSKVPKVVTLKESKNVYRTTKGGGQVSHITLIATIGYVDSHHSQFSTNLETVAPVFLSGQKTVSVETALLEEYGAKMIESANGWQVSIHIFDETDL